MKGKFFNGVIVIIVAVVMGYGISKSLNNSSTALDSLTSANVEALADGEIFIMKGEWHLKYSFVEGHPVVVDCQPGGCYICASPVNF